MESIENAPTTPRQDFALEVVRRRGPLSAAELGAWLCEYRGAHSHAEACEWDRSNGHSVCEALRRKGLVRRLRGRGWVAADWREPSDPDAYDPASVPWPVGY